MKTGVFSFVFAVVVLAGCIPDGRPKNTKDTHAKVNAFLMEYVGTCFSKRPLSGVEIRSANNIPNGSSDQWLGIRGNMCIDRYQIVPLKKKYRHFDQAVLYYDRWVRLVVMVDLVRKFDTIIDSVELSNEESVLYDIVHQEYLFDVDDQGRRAPNDGTFGILINTSADDCVERNKEGAEVKKSVLRLRFNNKALSDAIFEHHTPRGVYR